MKDMMGIDIESGQYVFYFRVGCGGVVYDEAEIILVRDKSIRVRFIGNRDIGQTIKSKGDESNIFNATGRIFILSKRPELERIVFRNQINNLTEENISLKAEVEKIHYRSDILDL